MPFPAILALRIFTLPFKPLGLVLGVVGASLLVQGGYQHAEDGAFGLVAAAMLLGIRGRVLRL